MHRLSLEKSNGHVILFEKNILYYFIMQQEGECPTIRDLNIVASRRSISQFSGTASAEHLRSQGDFQDIKKISKLVFELLSKY